MALKGRAGGRIVWLVPLWTRRREPEPEPEPQPKPESFAKPKPERKPNPEPGTRRKAPQAPRTHPHLRSPNATAPHRPRTPRPTSSTPSLPTASHFPPPHNLSYPPAPAPPSNSIHSPPQSRQLTVTATHLLHSPRHARTPRRRAYRWPAPSAVESIRDDVCRLCRRTSAARAADRRTRGSTSARVWALSQAALRWERVQLA